MKIVKYLIFIITFVLTCNSNLIKVFANAITDIPVNNIYITDKRSNYYLDLEKTGILEKGDEFINSIANMLFTFIRETAYIVISLFYYSMDFDVTKILENEINKIQNSLMKGIFNSLLTLAFFFICISILKKFIKRDLINVFTELGKVIFVTIISIFLVSNSADALRGATNITKEVSVQILTNLNSVSNTEFAVANSEMLWYNLIHQPYLTLQMLGSKNQDYSFAEKLLDHTPRSDERDNIVQQFAENNDGAFNKSIGTSRIPFLLFYIIPFLLKSVLYLIASLLQIGLQVVAVFFILLAPIILLLSLMETFGGISLLNTWFKKMFESQLGIIFITLTLGLIVKFDDVLYSYANYYGYLIVIIFQIVIAVILILFRNQIFNMFKITSKALHSPNLIKNKLAYSGLGSSARKLPQFNRNINRERNNIPKYTNNNSNQAKNNTENNLIKRPINTINKKSNIEHGGLKQDSSSLDYINNSKQINKTAIRDEKADKHSTNIINLEHTLNKKRPNTNDIKPNKLNMSRASNIKGINYTPVKDKSVVNGSERIISSSMNTVLQQKKDTLNTTNTESINKIRQPDNASTYKNKIDNIKLTTAQNSNLKELKLNDNGYNKLTKEIYTTDRKQVDFNNKTLIENKHKQTKETINQNISTNKSIQQSNIPEYKNKQQLNNNKLSLNKDDSSNKPIQQRNVNTNVYTSQHNSLNSDKQSIKPTLITTQTNTINTNTKKQNKEISSKETINLKEKISSTDLPSTQNKHSVTAKQNSKSNIISNQINNNKTIEKVTEKTNNSHSAPIQSSNINITPKANRPEKIIVDNKFITNQNQIPYQINNTSINKDNSNKLKKEVMNTVRDEVNTSIKKMINHKLKKEYLLKDNNKIEENNVINTNDNIKSQNKE